MGSSDTTDPDDAGKPRWLRVVDVEAFAAVPDSERKSQKLIDRASGGTTVEVRYIRTPPGGGSPRGLHTHPFDQHFYVLSGVMHINVDGDEFVAGPGSLVFFPRDVPHQNWNEGTEPTVHLAIESPMRP